MRRSTCLFLFVTILSWAAVVRSQDCQLQVPANPLTAQGLATPYELTGCNQLDFANQGAFVEAAILDPTTGDIQIYSPLVINAGMVPAGNSQTARQDAAAGSFIPPTVPTLPNDAVVGIWFGTNAATLTLTGSTDGCVNGAPNSVFGQFAYCNGQEWFNAAKTAVTSGLTKLPAPGTGSGDQTCPTTRDFRIVDQDQSDNVVTTYLLTGNNTLSQNTPANAKANPNAEVLSNASDNLLLTGFIHPALGCAPFQNPCTTCPTGKSAALATDELQANFFPPVDGPALVPLNNPMALVDGQESLQKVNLYRDGAGQPQADNNNASALTYCLTNPSCSQQFTQSGIFINDNQDLFTNAGSPAADAANNLFTFLAMRFSDSFGPAPGLGCTGLLNVQNPVTLTTDGNGVVTAATIDTQLLQGIQGGNNVVAIATSSAPVSAPTAAPSDSVGATSTASAIASGTPLASEAPLDPTSATGSVPSVVPSNTLGDTTGSTPATSSAAAPSASAATDATGSASAISACTGISTVAVTVTAAGCPTQTLATPTKYTGKWNKWKHGGHHGRDRVLSNQ